MRPSDLCHNTNMQLDLLHHAEKHHLFELDDAIEQAIEATLQQYVNASVNGWRGGDGMRLSYAVPTQATTGIAYYQAQTATYTAGHDYAEFNITLPPGMREREARWLIKQIVRECYEQMWDENL